ncbi:MAG: hypothetical protein ACYC0H_11890 [Solirubrobacteraceae bacterium]
MPVATASSFWGVDATGILAQSPQGQGLELRLARSVGITLGRFGVFWNAGEQIAALAQYGIEPYPVLTGGYGAFAARYGVGGSFWTAQTDPVHIYEIGNEPNIAQSPAQYAATYRQARAEIVAHDPRALVVVGGLAAIFPGDHFDVYDWTRQMIQALGSCPDAIGYHAYPASLAQLESGLTDERNALDQAGCPSTGIELNELYMLGGAPITLDQALVWIGHSSLGITRVILSLWCAAGDPLRGMLPAETVSGTIEPLGWTFLADSARIAAPPFPAAGNAGPVTNTPAPVRGATAQPTSGNTATATTSQGSSSQPLGQTDAGGVGPIHGAGHPRCVARSHRARRRRHRRRHVRAERLRRGHAARRRRT